MSIAILLLGLALGAGLGVVAVLAAGWRRRSLIPGSSVPISAGPVDEPADLRRTIEENPELCALYGRSAFPPEVEQACERILGELVGMVRTEIPDFAAFRAAVAEAERGSTARRTPAGRSSPRMSSCCARWPERGMTRGRSSAGSTAIRSAGCSPSSSGSP